MVHCSIHMGNRYQRAVPDDGDWVTTNILHVYTTYTSGLDERLHLQKHMDAIVKTQMGSVSKAVAVCTGAMPTREYAQSLYQANKHLWQRENRAVPAPPILGDGDDVVSEIRSTSACHPQEVPEELQLSE